ncbi:MAG: hypothetical protein IPJ32_16685 [Sphingobacteriaceae bacterium]|nr:hypothetical protein [Sphingobacteriaceae bacterium]
MNNADGASIANLDPSYSGLAYSTYLLDTINGSYYGFIDPKQNMLQTKNIIRSGKMNEMAIGYAYTFKDKLYLGASLGIPIVSYNHNSSYTESDDKDSLRIYRMQVIISNQLIRIRFGLTIILIITAIGWI